MSRPSPSSTHLLTLLLMRASVCRVCLHRTVWCLCLLCLWLCRLLCPRPIGGACQPSNPSPSSMQRTTSRDDNTPSQSHMWISDTVLRTQQEGPLCLIGQSTGADTHGNNKDHETYGCVSLLFVLLLLLARRSVRVSVWLCSFLYVSVSMCPLEAPWPCVYSPLCAGVYTATAVCTALDCLYMSCLMLHYFCYPSCAS
jgi:hypothetical protein